MKYAMSAGIGATLLVFGCFLALWKPAREAEDPPLPAIVPEQAVQLLLHDVIGSILADAIRKLGEEVSLTSDPEIAILEEVLRSNNRIHHGPLPGHWRDGAPSYQTFLVIGYGDSPEGGYRISRKTTLENWTLQVDQIGKHDRDDLAVTSARFVTSYPLDEHENVFWIGQHRAYTYSPSSRRWEPVNLCSP